MRDPDAKWPLATGENGEVRELPLEEQGVSLRNASWWQEIIDPQKEAIDTVWRSTPRSTRIEIIGEVCNGFHYIPYGFFSGGG